MNVDGSLVGRVDPSPPLLLPSGGPELWQQGVNRWVDSLVASAVSPSSLYFTFA
jgi:hypothetical protein